MSDVRKELGERIRRPKSGSNLAGIVQLGLHLHRGRKGTTFKGGDYGIIDLMKESWA